MILKTSQHHTSSDGQSGVICLRNLNGLNKTLRDFKRGLFLNVDLVCMKFYHLTNTLLVPTTGDRCADFHFAMCVLLFSNSDHKQAVVYFKRFKICEDGTTTAVPTAVRSCSRLISTAFTQLAQTARFLDCQ